MLFAKNEELTWTSEAGPRQTKTVQKMISAFHWRGKSHIEITDHGRNEFTVFGAELCDDAKQIEKTIHDKYAGEITRENFKEIAQAYESARCELVLPEVDNRTTQEQREERDYQRRLQEAKDLEQRELKAEQKADHVSELQSLYPWAMSYDGKISEPARAAKNIKKELRLVFPGIKFSVKSSSYSMGNSVDVSWTDGPTTDQVETIINKYQYGHFDGMQDMYVSDNSAYSDAVSEVLGQSKFVHGQRSTSEAIKNKTTELFCEDRGLNPADQMDYETERHLLKGSSINCFDFLKSKGVHFCVGL